MLVGYPLIMGLAYAKTVSHLSFDEQKNLQSFAVVKLNDKNVNSFHSTQVFLACNILPRWNAQCLRTLAEKQEDETC